MLFERAEELVGKHLLQMLPRDPELCTHLEGENQESLKIKNLQSRTQR